MSEDKSEISKDGILNLLNRAGLGFGKIKKTVGNFKEDMDMISKYNIAALKALNNQSYDDTRKILDAQRILLDKFKGLQDFNI